MSDAGADSRGRLVLVATPIGNLGDLPPRARAVLETADLICCEDTRRTRALLSACGITSKGPKGDRLLSLHGHNEASRLDPDFMEELELDPSLEPSLQADERELEEAGAELDDPEQIAVLDGLTRSADAVAIAKLIPRSIIAPPNATNGT